MEFDWNTLKIDQRLIGIVKNVFHFKNMTLVQKATIPMFINHKDICCEACTGSGKSLAFIISILEILIKCYNNEPFNKFFIGALIISPTRELSHQTYNILEKFLKDQELGTFIKSQLLIGGKNLIIDGENFLKNGANILVATPGRLVDVLERYSQVGSQLKKCLQVLVIDETDVLLNLGFEKKLNQILTFLPKQRRTGLFSATQIKMCDKLIKLSLRNPVWVEIKEKPTFINYSHRERLSKEIEMSLKSTGLQISPYLSNKYIILEKSSYKIPFLINFLTKNLVKKYLVFFSTCAQVNHFFKAFEKFSNTKAISIFKIHRKLRTKRQKIFDQFKSCKQTAILFCTDIMSRGIDIPKIDWVINADLPNTIQDYIHRSGRSGHQIGIQGNSLMLCLPQEIEFVNLCKEKGINFEQIECDKSQLEPISEKICEWLREEARSSLLSYEVGMKAFVSFLRNYSSKNIMSQVLFNKMNFVELANSFGLLSIPIMPELKRKLKSCPTRLKIKDGDKELVQKYKVQLFKVSNNNNEDKRKYNKNKITEQRQRMKSQIESCKLKGKKKKRFLDQLEFEELAEDARMVKKLKKGLINQDQFDKHFGLD